MTPEMKAIFDELIDTFAAGDGGMKLLQYRMLIEGLCRRLDTDPAADQVLDVVRRFNRLLEVSRR